MATQSGEDLTVNDILQFMFQDGHLTASEVVALRKTCRELNENPIRVLRSLNIASSEEIQDFIQRIYRVPGVTDKTLELLDESFKALIPIDIAVSFGVFAIAENGNRLHVAMEDPSDRGLIHKLEFFLDRRIVPVAATINQILVALNKLYDVPAEQVRLATVLETSRGVVLGHRTKRIGPSNREQPARIEQQTTAGMANLNEEQSIDDLTSRAMAAEPVLDTVAMPQEDFSDLANQSASDFGLVAESEELDTISAPASEPVADAGTTLIPDDAITGDLQPGEMVFFDSTPTSAPVTPPVATKPTTNTATHSDFGIANEASDMSPGDLVFFDAPTPSEPAAAAQEAPVTSTTPIAPTADSASDFSDLSDSLPMLDAEQAATDVVAAVPSFSDPEPSLGEWSGASDENLTLDSASVPATDASPDLIGDLTLDDANIAPELSSTDTLDLTNDELDLAPDDLSATEPEPISDETPPSYSAQELSRLAAAINATLLKLTFAPNREKAMAILNDRLASLGLRIEEPRENAFRVEYQGRVIEGDLRQPPSLKEPLFDAILPILRRLEKIRR